MDKKQFKPINKNIAAVIVLTYLVILILSHFIIDVRWLYCDAPYADMGFSQWYAGIYRIAYYGFATITGACFLSLVPDKKRIYTRLGSITLYIFLVHQLIINAVFLII